MSLAVTFGSVKLPNPILVASGTFGYAAEMALVGPFASRRNCSEDDYRYPSGGQSASRTAETTAGLLNAIGLDNDGIDEFVEQKLPYCALGTPIIVSVAAKA